MSIEKLIKHRKSYTFHSRDFDPEVSEFMAEVINTFEEQYKQLAKKEDAIDIGDVIKEARLRNG